MAEEKLLTTKEVADILGMARPSSVSKLVMLKKLPCVKKGKLTYFNEDDVLKYMEARDEKGKKVVEPVKDAEPDIAEDGMRFTAYGKSIGKDPKECSTPVTPLDKRHLFANVDGFEKFVGDELEKNYIDTDIKTCDEAKRAINNVFGLDKTIKVDGKCDIHIDIDARVIAHKYIKSLSDEEFVELFRHALKERLK